MVKPLIINCWTGESWHENEDGSRTAYKQFRICTKLNFCDDPFCPKLKILNQMGITELM